MTNLEELKEKADAYDVLTGLLVKRFPQQKDGTLPDFKVETLLAQNLSLMAVSKRLVELFEPYRNQLDDPERELLEQAKSALRS